MTNARVFNTSSASKPLLWWAFFHSGDFNLSLQDKQTVTSQPSMRASLHNTTPRSGASKWNAAIVNVIRYTRVWQVKTSSYIFTLHKCRSMFRTCTAHGESVYAHMLARVAGRKQTQASGYTQRSMVSLSRKTHRQRWMFPNTWQTRADSELTNSLSSSAARSGQPWHVRHTRRLKQEETGAPQVHAHIPHRWCSGQQTYSNQ